MRKEFSQWIEQFGRRESRLIFLTGDLGFAALESVRTALDHRFVNLGVSEQNMVSVAAGLAQQGLLPLCYSIAPFVVFRPLEQIRLDVALHNLPVKIVGNGGGYGYGIMGASHHALEDLAVLSCLPNFACVVPLCNSDVAGAAEALFAHPGPGYLRLGLGVWPEALGALPDFAPTRKLFGASNAKPKLTVVGLGPVLMPALAWLRETGRCEVFAVSQLPLPHLDPALQASVQASGQLLVIEEHVARGGLGEHLSARLAAAGTSYRLHHLHARGYPTGRYGSQAFHQRQSGLDFPSVRDTVIALTA
ncbi:MAG: transketolase [Lacunisphaera sp.]|nr:transketolase [Lacunisphaera sp.]